MDHRYSYKIKSHLEERLDHRLECVNASLLASVDHVSQHNVVCHDGSGSTGITGPPDLLDPKYSCQECLEDITHNRIYRRWLSLLVVYRCQGSNPLRPATM